MGWMARKNAEGLRLRCERYYRERVRQTHGLFVARHAAEGPPSLQAVLDWHRTQWQASVRKADPHGFRHEDPLSVAAVMQAELDSLANFSVSVGVNPEVVIAAREDAARRTTRNLGAT